MTNKETGEYLGSFHKREEALIRRARLVGFDIDAEPWSAWQTWFADPETYLNALRNAVVAAEAIERRGTP